MTRTPQTHKHTCAHTPQKADTTLSLTHTHTHTHTHSHTDLSPGSFFQKPQDSLHVCNRTVYMCVRGQSTCVCVTSVYMSTREIIADPSHPGHNLFQLL